MAVNNHPINLNSKSSEKPLEEILGGLFGAIAEAVRPYDPKTSRVYSQVAEAMMGYVGAMREFERTLGKAVDDVANGISGILYYVNGVKSSNDFVDGIKNLFGLLGTVAGVSGTLYGDYQKFIQHSEEVYRRAKDLEYVLENIGINPRLYYFGKFLRNIPTSKLEYIANIIEKYGWIPAGLGIIFNKSGFVGTSKCLKDAAEAIRKYIEVRKVADRLDGIMVELPSYIVEGYKMLAQLSENKGNIDEARVREWIERGRVYSGILEEFNKMAEEALTKLYNSTLNCPHFKQLLEAVVREVDPNYDRHKYWSN